MKSLFGYANTTKAIARSGGWAIYDDKFERISSDEWGNLLLPSSHFKAEKSQLEIPSPGFAPSHELILKARNLISEYDYFFDMGMPKSVWISGTNGKTTTTKMCEHLLRLHGAFMGGNVGIALADLPRAARLWILETSSFTIHYTKRARPDIYALLPITPDHLSWHGDMNGYENAKLKPLSMMNEQCIAIIPACFKEREIVRNSKAKIYFYSSEQDLADTFGLECDYERVNTFVIENNKLEELRDNRGRLWVNDTKATNIDASMQAIRRYENEKIFIILGGDDKGVDLSPVFDALSVLKQEPKIYAIGSNTEKIVNLARNSRISCLACYELKEAVKAIDTDFSGSGVALLSPACASLDQFKSYAQRGDIFKEEIANLK